MIKQLLHPRALAIAGACMVAQILLPAPVDAVLTIVGIGAGIWQGIKAGKAA